MEGKIIRKRLLSLASWFVPQHRGSIEPAEIRNILAIRLDHIGDVLLTTPAFAALRERFPEAHIVALVGSWAREIVEGNPNVDEVIFYDLDAFNRSGRGESSFAPTLLRLARILRARNFDLAIAFRTELRTTLLPFFAGARFRVGHDFEARGFLLNVRVPFSREPKHIVEHNLDLIRAVGPSTEGPIMHSLYMPVRDEDRVFARRLLADCGIIAGRPLVGIHPGAGYPVKQWRKEGFARVADQLIDKGAQVVITGGPGKEERLAGEVADLMNCKPAVLAGKTGLRQLAAVAELCDVFLANDSGPMHIAAAVGTPVVDIRSAADVAGFWEPYGEGHIVITKEIHCSPCYKKECETHECLKDITEEEVMEAVVRLLSMVAGKKASN